MLGSRHIAPATLVAYMDAELGPEETQAVAEHLANCQKCFQKAVRQGRTSQLIRSAVPIGANSPQIGNLTPKLDSRLQEEINSVVKSNALRLQPKLGLIISCVVLAFVLIYGVQSLLRDVIARNAKVNSGKVSAYVEDHLSFESTYRVSGELRNDKPGVQQ